MLVCFELNMREHSIHEGLQVFLDSLHRSKTNLAHASIMPMAVNFRLTRFLIEEN